MSKPLLRTAMSAFVSTFCGVADYASASEFCFRSPGSLSERDSAAGSNDRTIYITEMAFPLKVGRASDLDAHLNSQIFGYGGQYGPGGSLTDKRNYQGCWQDTYCEGKRSWKMPLCPARVGHQGNDIRPHGPEDNKYEAVAFGDGYIRLKTSNTTVVVAGDDGTECRYLHLHPSSIADLKIGDRVVKGKTVLGKVSDWMGGKAHGTSRHLHFDCSQVFDLGSGKSSSLHIPIYTSLVFSYAASKGLDGISSSGEELQNHSKYEIP